MTLSKVVGDLQLGDEKGHFESPEGVLICSDFFSKTLLLEELFMTRLWTPKVWHPRFLFFSKVMQLSLKITAKMAPENRPKNCPKRKQSYSVFQPSIFRCKLFVSGRVTFLLVGGFNTSQVKCVTC